MQWLNFVRIDVPKCIHRGPTLLGEGEGRRRGGGLKLNDQSLSLLTQFVKRPVPRTRHVTDLSPSSVCVTNPRGCVQGHAMPRYATLSSSLSARSADAFLVQHLSAPLRFNIAIVDRSELEK